MGVIIFIWLILVNCNCITRKSIHKPIMLGVHRARMSKSKSSPSIRRVSSASSFQNRRINRDMDDDMAATNTAALMWQCACTISSARSVLQRANGNSLKYYTLTHIDSMSPEKLHKSADHKM